MVAHEAKRQKQDPQSKEGARRQDPQNQVEVRDMPGSGSDAHPHELEPTADAPLNSNAEGKRQAQPNPKMLNFGNLPDVNKRVCKQRKNKNEIKQVSLSAW